MSLTKNDVFRKLFFNKNLFLIFVFLFFAQNIFSAPATITFQARIIKPDLTNLEASNVFFRFYYIYPKPVGTDNQCVIYVEEISGVNMSGSKGLVTLQMGTGTKTYGVGDLKNVFDNSTASYTCQAGGTYVPSASDNRRVIIQFDDGSGVQTLPPSELTSVPFAMQSYNSQRLGNSLPTEFLKFTDFSGTCAAGEYLTYDAGGSPKFTCAIPVGGGSGTVTSVTSGGAPIVVGGTATDPTISLAKATAAVDGYLSSADWTTFNSKLSNFSTLTSADITAKYGYTPLDSAGAVTSVAGRTGVVTLSSGDITGLSFGTTAGTYAQGNDSRFTDTRTPTDNTVSATKIIDGTITSADISAGAITFDKLNQSSASAGQVIKWDGAAWVASSDASLVSSDISTALGYTAANSADVSAKVSKSGDTMTGTLNLNASTALATSTGTFSSGVADGAAAIAYTFDTSNNLATSTAKIASFKNNGSEKAYVNYNGAFVG